MPVREFLGLLGEEILDPDEGSSTFSLFPCPVSLIPHMGSSWDSHGIMFSAGNYPRHSYSGPSTGSQK